MTTGIEKIFKMFEGENIEQVKQDFDHQIKAIYTSNDDFDKREKQSIQRRIRAIMRYQKQYPGRTEF